MFGDVLADTIEIKCPYCNNWLDLNNGKELDNGDKMYRCNCRHWIVTIISKTRLAWKDDGDKPINHAKKKFKKSLKLPFIFINGERYKPIFVFR